MPTNQIVLPRDQRSRLRFPLNTELRYQSLRHGQGPPVRGNGQVENISSKGLAFHADAPLQPGQRLNVSIAWPARLDNECMLRLAFEGVVLRTRGNLVVVSIEHPDFRTAGKGTALAREEIAAMAGSLASMCAVAASPS